MYERFHLADYPSRFSLGEEALITFKMLHLETHLFDFPDAKILCRGVSFPDPECHNLSFEWYRASKAERLYTSGIFTLDYNERGYCTLVNWQPDSNFGDAAKARFLPFMCHPALLNFIPYHFKWRAALNPHGFSL